MPPAESSERGKKQRNEWTKIIGIKNTTAVQSNLNSKLKKELEKWRKNEYWKISGRY